MYRFWMNRPARIGLELLGFFLAASLLAYAALFFVLRSPSFREWAQAELSRRSGMEVRFADLRLRPPLQLVAGALEVSKSGEFVFHSARLSLTLVPLDLWFGTVHRVSAEQPVLTVDLLQIMKPAGPSSAVIGLRHFTVRDGSFVVKKGPATVFALPNINLEARNLNIGQESGIRLRADVPWLEGETDLHLAGSLRALTSEIVIRPAQKASLANKLRDRPEWLRLRAHVEAPQEQPVKATIVGKLDRFPVGGGQVSGGVDVRAAIDSQWEEALFNGQVTIQSLAQALGPIGHKLPGGGATIDIAGSFALPGKTFLVNSMAVNFPFGKAVGKMAGSFVPEPRISSAQLSWSDVPLLLLQPLLPPTFAGWTFDGRAQVALSARGPWNAPDLQGVARGEATKVQSSEIRLASMTFALPFSWSKGVTRIDDAKIAATGLAYTDKNGWKATAERAQASATMDFSDAASLKIAGTLEAGGGKFQSPDANKIGENLRVRGPVAIDWFSAKETARITADLTAESGEILWNTFFADLQTPKPRISFDGDYARAQDRLECRRGALVLANIGAVDIVGSIEELAETPRFRLQVRSANFLPGGFFETLLRENLKRQYPFVETLRLRGTLAFDVHVSGNREDLAAAGDLSLSGGGLRARTDDWEIGEISLKLPFAVGWGGAAKAGGDPRPGTLSVGRILFARRDVKLSPAKLTLFQNELRFDEPLRAAAFGGDIVVGNLRWPDLIRLPRQMAFSLAASRLQLEDLTEALGWPRFSGTLTGSIPEVQSAGAILKTNGELRAEVFGGRVRISKLEIENPFSALAAIRLDAALANIDLEQLSRTFAFGRISGILEGTVADLMITDGQPARFGADLHSVDRGREQRISVEALDKITVLSSGRSAGALYGGLAGLFDSFRYSKLGFKAILRNDRLVLRGVETRGDQEYLVVGSILPPTVNIVSHTQTIGFSELLRRLERIQTNQPKAQ